MSMRGDNLEAPPGPILSIRDLEVVRGGGFQLTVGELNLYRGEILSVIGPNGAGKSTLLLTLARLFQPSNGELWFKGVPFSELDELDYRRDIALVLQEPLLFSTTVFENVASGLRFRRRPNREIEAKVVDWLSRLEIAHLRDRKSSTLSGGQAQRTSLARALVLDPELLLLDEPFGALDYPTRKALMSELRNLLHETGITSVFITHDRDEALFFGDRIAVLLDGKMHQIGNPQEVFTNPSDPLVAEFVGAENILDGKVLAVQNGRTSIDIHGVQIEAVGDYRVGQEVLLCLRPEDITLWPINVGAVSSARNRITGTVTDLVLQGPLVRVVVDCGPMFSVLITRASADELQIKGGDQVTLSFKASAAHLIQK
jgi:tungstate transport system ATP-binding protein